MTIGIYAIQNIKNNKMYVGSSINIERRLRKHFSELRKAVHPNGHLQSAFIKYGEATFKTKILELCAPNELIQKEQHWIDCTDHLYNMNKDAARPPHTPESIAKMRQKKLGKKHSEEHKQNIGRSLFGRVSGMRGKKHSKDTLQKMSASQRNKVLSEETKQKLSNAHKGKKLSDEHRQHLSDAKKGKLPSEAQLKYYESKRGQPQSEESIQKRAIALRGKKRTEETKAKMRAAWEIRRKKLILGEI